MLTAAMDRSSSAKLISLRSASAYYGAGGCIKASLINHEILASCSSSVYMECPQSKVHNSTTILCIGADTMGHRGARAPHFWFVVGTGGTDNRYETFDTLVNWAPALGSYLANKDTVM